MISVRAVLRVACLTSVIVLNGPAAITSTELPLNPTVSVWSNSSAMETTELMSTVQAPTSTVISRLAGGAGDAQLLATLMEAFTVYVLALIGLGSILGNTVNLVVMVRECPAISPYTYLIALAACDLGTGVCVLWQAVFRGERLLGASHAARLVSHYSLVTNYTVKNVLATASAYLAMVLGVDRLIAVKYPLHRAAWCTLRRSRLATAVILVASILLNLTQPFRLHSIWIPQSRTGLLMPKVVYTSFGSDPRVKVAILYLTLVIKILIPLTCMIVTNSLTLKAVTRSQRFRKTVSQTGKDGEQVQCVAITIGVIVLFIITNVPRAAYFIHNAVMAGRRKYTLTTVLLTLMSEAIVWSNACCNFFIYAILNRKFRHDVRKIFCPGCGGNPTKKNPGCDSNAKHTETTPEISPEAGV